MRKAPKLFSRLAAVIAACALLEAGLIAVHFPYDTDVPLSSAEKAKTVAFYEKAYASPAGGPLSPEEEKYVKGAQGAAHSGRVKEKLADFVAEHGLKNKKALDVGAGSGYLQDVVDDYTGLDISPTAGRFYHKRFVLGSATALPFPDRSFDIVWSMMVLEHIPNPEQALREMRRVLKDGGFLYLYPTWNCASWAAQGYDVRPYSDFGFRGKLVKASIPVRSSKLYYAAYQFPMRFVRLLSISGSDGPSTLHYIRLSPNYEKYWEADSDAVNSIDRYETLLWFLSRGDECVNCPGKVRSLFPFGDMRLIIQAKKRAE